jgi:predicted phage terminase large subunit-like protein
MKKKKAVSLLDFIPRVSPRFTRPDHLAPVAALFERAMCEPVHAVISVPPRMGKTELMKHNIAWRLLQAPATRVMYASYGARLSEKKSRETRSIYLKAGGPIADDAQSRSDWRTGVDDGGMWATGVGGAFTGDGGELLICDDPHKGRAEAESALEREKVHEWFRDDFTTREEPGASTFVIQTRWHPDDLAGHLIGQGWEHITLPAIDSEGNALWPARYSAERLNEIRETIGEYSWASLYQQSPRPRGGALFGDVVFYDQLPSLYRVGKGCDLAYTAKTRADKSAAVVMLESEGIFYVADVRTAQVKVPDFLATLAIIDHAYHGPWHWFTSTTEVGVADLATATAGVHVVAERAAVDKFMRAQGVAAAWNAGKVRLPRRAPWLDSFVSEICGFVGVGDRHDDQVDALSSAFTRLAGPNVYRPPPPGAREAVQKLFSNIFTPPRSLPGFTGRGSGF